MPIPNLDAERCQLGVTTSRWPLNLFTSCGHAGTQAWPWKVLGASWGSQPQDGLQVFSPLVDMLVPKLDPKRCQLGVTTPRWLSCLLTICGRASTQVGPWKVSVGGHGPKLGFKLSFKGLLNHMGHLKQYINLHRHLKQHYRQMWGLLWSKLAK